MSLTIVCFFFFISYSLVTLNCYFFKRKIGCLSQTWILKQQKTNKSRSFMKYANLATGIPTVTKAFQLKNRMQIR